MRQSLHFKGCTNPGSTACPVSLFSRLHERSNCRGQRRVWGWAAGRKDSVLAEMGRAGSSAVERSSGLY